MIQGVRSQPLILPGIRVQLITGHVTFNNLYRFEKTDGSDLRIR